MDKVFALLGASNHSKEARQSEDYYATGSVALEALLEREPFSDVWECAAGGGHLCRVLEDRGILGRKSDIVDRGIGAEVADFLSASGGWDGDIVTNPPYSAALAFVRKAVSLIRPGRKAAFLLRIQFLEGIERRAFFDGNPPKFVYVFTKRVNCPKNGDFSAFRGTAMCYAWFVWEKGFKGEPTVRWL